MNHVAAKSRNGHGAGNVPSQKGEPPGLRTKSYTQGMDPRRETVFGTRRRRAPRDPRTASDSATERRPRTPRRSPPSRLRHHNRRGASVNSRALYGRTTNKYARARSLSLSLFRRDFFRPLFILLRCSPCRLVRRVSCQQRLAAGASAAAALKCEPCARKRFPLALARSPLSRVQRESEARYMNIRMCRIQSNFRRLAAFSRLFSFWSGSFTPLSQQQQQQQEQQQLCRF